MKSNKNNKIVLIGEKRVGKTSIFSMIFTNIYPSETSYLESTQSISHNQIIYSGGELIELDDCGFEQYTENEYYIKAEAFENVSTLIFVINAEPPKENSNSCIPITNNEKYDDNIIDNYFIDLQKINKNNFLENCLKLLSEKSPKANVYIFIHKMDTILMDKRKNIFEGKKEEINQKLIKMNLTSKIFATSIWDGSLYVPWREIMSDMVLNKIKLEKGLNFLLESSNADEIFLFERNTLLCICSVDKGKDINKEERTKKISILIKKIKQALRKNNEGFSTLKMRLNNIMVYIEEFTKYSYIMIISQKPKINYELLSLNIYILKKKLLNNFNYK